MGRKWKMPLEAPDLPYEIIEIESQDSGFEYLLEQSATMKVCAIDTETTSNLKPNKKKGEMYVDWAQGARAFMATFCASDDTVFATYSPDITKDIMYELDRGQIRQTYQNCKFDLHHLREWADYTPSTLELPLDDTMFGFRLRFPRYPASLKQGSKRYVPNFDTTYWQRRVHDWLATANAIREENTLWWQPNKANFSDVPKEIMLPYSTGDAWLTLKSWYGLTEDKAFESQLYRDEVALTQLLVRVEKAGWRIKKDVLQRHIETARRNYRLAAQELELVCPGLNVFSSPELTKVFYENLGEEIIFTSDKGNPSTSETALIRFNKNPTLRDLVLKVRHWKKTKDTLETLDYFTSSDSCVHSNLKSEAAITGRFGSENPNLQNLSAYSEDKDWTIARENFGPEEGFVHLFADYKQIEMVIYADYTRDPGLVNAIINDLDLHTTTASLMFAVPFDQLTEMIRNGDKLGKLYRKLGKGMNFTIIFGAGPNKVAFMLQYGDKHGEGAIDLDTVAMLIGRRGTFKEAGKHLVDVYYRGLPTAKIFNKRAREKCESRRPRPYVTNKFGRIIPIDSGFEYKAPNALVQGSAADLMKNAMRRSWKTCDAYCKEAGLEPWKDIQLFTTVHDELGFKIRADHLQALAPRIKDAMCNWGNMFVVPIRAEFSLVTPDSDYAHKKVIEV